MSSNEDNSSSEANEPNDNNQQVVSVEMNAVSTSNASGRTFSKSVTKQCRRVDYKVEGVGMVTEEWRVQQSTTNDQSEANLAIYAVFIDGTLVREVDLNTMKVLKSEPKYEPYSFLRYGAASNAIENGSKK